MHNATTRRAVLGGIATTMAGGTALMLWPDDSAAISISGLNVSDSSTDLAPGEVVDAIHLEANTEHDYESSHALDRRQIRLLVDPNGAGYEAMASLDKRENVPQEVTGETNTIAANLFDHPALSQSDVDPSTGETVTHTLAVKVELRLFKNGQQVGLADAEATGVSLSVSQSEVTVSAQVGGTGAMTVERGTATA